MQDHELSPYFLRLLLKQVKKLKGQFVKASLIKKNNPIKIDYKRFEIYGHGSHGTKT